MDSNPISTDDKRKWLANLFCLVQDATTKSCWHHNNDQSEAMWKLYATNVKSAVAIRTTVGKLQKQFAADVTFKIREVEYIDYMDYVPDVYEAKWYKRRIFKHEQEVRIARVEPHYGQRTYNSDGSVARTGGIAHHIPFCFNELVDKIYISPYAPMQFADTVASIKAKYKLNCPIIFQDREYPADAHWEKPRTIMERYRKGCTLNE